jgi:hypothetical protein
MAYLLPEQAMKRLAPHARAEETRGRVHPAYNELAAFVIKL